MTTLDHTVEEGCIRILLEVEGEGGREGGREGYFSCFHVYC
jgi:hypothetical protein